VAGLHTAWRTSVGADVMLLTKRSLFDSATAYAQGGIAAALGAGDLQLTDPGRPFLDQDPDRFFVAERRACGECVLRVQFRRVAGA
jgi:succinate dehydrogenase/fumarate reductase flavoprotein subunit